MPVRGQASYDQDNGAVKYAYAPIEGEMTPPEFNATPFEFNGQWWQPKHYSEIVGDVTDNPDNYADDYTQGIFRNYGYDLRPRLTNGVAAVPYDDYIRFQKAFSPDNSFGDKWGAFPMLAAVIGGAAYAGMGAAEGAAAGAGGGAGGGASAGIPAGINYTASLPSEFSLAGGTAGGGGIGLNSAGGLGLNASGGLGLTAGGNALLTPAVAAGLGGAELAGLTTAAGLGAGGAAAGGAAGAGAGAAAGASILDKMAAGALPAGASLLGAGIAADSANKAIDAQTQGTNAALAATSQAAQDAIAEQRRQYDLNRADYAPYRDAGNQAVGRINGMLQPGGDLTRRFTVGDFYADPVTQLSMDFGLSEGRKALERAARANGSLNSGGTLKALTRYGTDYAGQRANESYNRFYGDQDRTFNRNASLAGLGQTATAGTVNAGQNSANNIAGITTNQGNTIGNLYSSLGNSRGAASIAQGNTFNNALSNIGNWWTNQNMLDSLLAARK